MRPHRRFATLVVALLMLAGTAPVAAAGESPPKLTPTGTDVLAHNSWIVALEPDVDVDRAGAIAKAAGGRAGLKYEHVLHGFQFKGSAAAARQLEKNPLVESVEADRPLFLTEVAPFGIDRIHAWGFGGPDDGAYQAGFRGAGTRIAILDTGIDLDHPDLAASIDQAAGKNCLSSTLPPEDGHGHGTHVSGTAAAPLNGVGVVGVAPEAKLIPIKMFDDAGNSSLALSLCALNRVVALNTDASATNDVDVVSMSWGEHRTWGSCAADSLHGAICSAQASGAILVAGAGNDARDAGDFVPAAYPEVISVSAYSDFDGDSGGRSGCQFVLSLFWTECDDTFAFFSDFGASVDVMAPGVNVYSTWTGGGYQTIDGTSMATPHVAGTVALMRGVDPELTPDEALAFLRANGECPNGAQADADGTAGCAGQGTWRDDPDGIPEPLVNALAATRAAGAVQPPPPPTTPSAPQLTVTPSDRTATLQWTAPSSDGGATISGYNVYRRIGSGAEAAAGSTDGSTFEFVDSNLTNGTQYTYRVAALNSAGEGTKSNAVTVTPTAPVVVTAPGAPTNLKATAKGVGSVNLTWSAPASNGGSAITGYDVYRKGPGDTSFTKIRTVGPTATSYTDSDQLVRRTTYVYVVRAFNASFASPDSNQASVRTR